MDQEIIEILEILLLQCWSSETSSLWSQDNPARGQCDITAIVINDFFGGEILKTFIDEQAHFYNRIDGVNYDLTASQFQVLPEYLDLLADREEIFNSNLQVRQQYHILYHRFTQVLQHQLLAKNPGLQNLSNLRFNKST